MFKRLATIAAVLFCAAAIAFLARPAAATQWDAGARAADEAYWAAYNRGDADAMNAWLSLDVEFYHDRGGKLIGKKALAAANDGMKTNRTRLRREAIPGTVRFYPMREGETVYGAMAVGEHRFYAKEDGKPEELVGRANYTHLMRLEGNQWRIARIFSFEHIDAP